MENTVRGSVGHASAAGSPPHTWRILHILDYEGRNIGITSTYVENTSWVKRQFQPHGDHLHIRGEYTGILGTLGASKGSPPHTWRIRKIDSFVALRNRITSTYVENTFLQAARATNEEDHLHIRGEYFHFLGIAPQKLGSPPHTWRIQIDATQAIQTARITSTYVENTVNKSLYSAK